MYTGFITKIKNLRKHTNADRLQIGECFGNNVIVGLEIKEGQLGCYFPVDGCLNEEFAKLNNLLRVKNEDGTYSGGYLDPEKRNIKAIKLRGEKSDGLWLPIESLSHFADVSKMVEGELITVLKGVEICKKYIPAYTKNTDSIEVSKIKKDYKNSFPLFVEHLDTEQLAYNLHNFNEGDHCTITLKIHGTSARTTNTIKEENTKQTFLQRLFKINKTKTKTWEYVSGSRRRILNDYNGGFYGDNAFRKKYHDLFVGKLQKGETIYYEIVGYTDDNGLIMSECNNKKTNDKEFIKKYGETTKFTYGCKPGENDVYVYRMTMTNEDGYVVEYPWELVKVRCEQMCVKHAPEFESFIFKSEEDLMQRVELYCDGEDPIGKTHVREGVVVRINNKPKFTALKHKGFNFKVLEGIIKSDALAPDLEEQQDLFKDEVQK